MARPRRTSQLRPGSRAAEAADLMIRFAERTGVAPGRPPHRYLWTDAFAVCNALGLADATGDPRFDEMARGLIHQVHRILGRHREDEERRGPLAGEETAARDHPTRGGLRIGKPLPERGPGDPYDADLEWERDGQYFHYLTRWMHALDQAACAWREPRLNLWARELAQTACRAFVVETGPGQAHLAWKMSIDLSRPLTHGASPHDALDGALTCLQLRATAAFLGSAGHEGSSLDREIAQLIAMNRASQWPTSDPLSLGGLLLDAHRAAVLSAHGAAVPAGWVALLLNAALAGLSHLEYEPAWGRASERPAFRELGLALGLAAVVRVRHLAFPGVADRLERVSSYAALGERIVSYWRQPEARSQPSFAGAPRHQRGDARDLSRSGRVRGTRGPRCDRLAFRAGMSRVAGVAMLLALLLPWSSARAEPAPLPRGYSLGKAHVWLRGGRLDLRQSVENEWGLDEESFLGLEGYCGRGYETYLGGEIGFAAKDSARNASGDRLEDLHFRWGGPNVKHAFPIRHGLSFDAGAGFVLFYVDGREISSQGGTQVSDPLADLGYGLQVLGDFNWRYRALIVGLDARFQYVFDLFEIDYSNFGVGAHLGLAF